MVIEIGPHSSVGIPPDSTGKRLANTYVIHITYKNGVASITRNNIIVGQASGASGTAIAVDGTISTGIVSVLLAFDSPALSFTNDEILLVDGYASAEVQASEKEYIQAYTLVGGNNRFNAQFVDDKGSAFVRYGEGEQQLDALGLSRQTTPTQLAQYVYAYSDLAEEFSIETTGDGYTVYLPNEQAVTLNVGIDIGDSVSKTSDKYHIYQAGFGQLVEMSVACGDFGKENVRRRWGYFDGYNGLFFEQEESTINIVVRSFSAGFVEETRISQQDWNNDILDGSSGLRNISGINLDVTKLSIYWLDFTWFGAGRTRFGIYAPNGNRVTAHVIENSNNLAVPYMSTGRLPVRFEIENTGPSPSPSILKGVCTAVKTDGHVLDTRERRSEKTALINSDFKIMYDGYDSHIMSFRSAALFSGKLNRVVTVPELVSFYVEDAPILVKLFKNTILDEPTDFIQPAGSALEFDESDVDMTGGFHIVSWFVSEGSLNQPFPPNFNVFDESIFLKANGLPGNMYTLVARSLKVGVQARVLAAVSAIDII